MTSQAAPARLRWVVGDLLTDDARAQLMGPGARHELSEETVLGRRLTVFRNRPRSVGAVLASAAERFGDRPYLIFPDEQLSYAEVLRLARRTASLLQRTYGIQRGDRVAIASANSLSYAVAFWGVALAGAVNAGLNGWWTGDELRYGIELSGPSLILADDARRDRLIDAGSDPSSIHSLDRVLDEVRAADDDGVTEPANAQLEDVDEDDPLLILFTSGTTGRPKGATLSHRNFIHHTMTVELQAASRAALVGMPPTAADPPTSICASPLFHVSGALPLLSAPAAGTTLVFSPPGRWDETTHLRLTADHGVTSWSGVPTQFWRLLEHPDFDRYDLSSLRTAGGGGATFAPELLRLFAEKLPHVTFGAGYGLSETAGMGASIGGDIYLQYPTSVGAAQPTSEIEIRDGDDIVPEGAVGEICLRHAAVFRGYWNDPEATRATTDDDGWCRTGDFGRIEGGLLYLESRMRDMIIRGGENIYPIEIENRLVEHPDIADAAVVGVHHRALGQEVKACVVLADGRQLDATSVQSWVADALARFKVPTHVEFLDTLPRTASGKVMKHVLEQRSD